MTVESASCPAKLIDIRDDEDPMENFVMCVSNLVHDHLPQEFISLLTLLIGESKFVQNHEAMVFLPEICSLGKYKRNLQGLIPQEAKVAGRIE